MSYKWYRGAFFLNKVIFHVLKPLLHDHEVAQEIMKITKRFALEVKKSVFIPNNNKQDGNKTFKKNQCTWPFTWSHSCVVYGNYGVIVRKKIYK